MALPQVTQHAAGANMSVDVSAGAVSTSSGTTAVPAANPAITTADPTQDRQDAVVANPATGAVSVLAGPVNDGLNAQPPDTTGYVALGYVYVISQASVDYTGTIINAVITANPTLAAVTGWTTLTKLANTARSVTVTLAADPDLQFAMGANTTYIIRGMVRFDASVSLPGFKYDFSGPTSPARLVVAISDAAQGGTPAPLALDSAYAVTHTQTTSATANASGIVKFEILVENGSNAGTFSFRWAQNTSGGTSLNVRPGSYLEYLVS